MQAPDPKAPEGQWLSFHERVARLRPPLAPPPDLAERMQATLDQHAAGSHVLLLGMTRALFGIGQRMLAVDWSADMIASLWPGDSPTRRAQCADWGAIEAQSAPFSAVVGDGSLNVLQGADDVARVVRRLAAISSGAQVLLRCFVSPAQDEADSLEQLKAAAIAGEAGGFHAFKWRIAMALAAASGPLVAVDRIQATFCALFPDRQALARQTGWVGADFAEIDAYRGSSTCLWFPTREQLLAAVGNPPGSRFIASGTYELAERCPLLTWRMA